MSAAKSADLLFVKIKPGSGNDLAKHCEREGIKYKAFESFEQVKETVQAVVEGKLKIGDVGKLGQIDPNAKD